MANEKEFVNSALIYFNDNNRLGGFFTKPDRSRLLVTGSWTPGSETVVFDLIDEQSGARRGHGTYRKVQNPRSAKAPVATGHMEVDDAEWDICVRPAKAAARGTDPDAKVVTHSVFPDRMAKAVDAPF